MPLRTLSKAIAAAVKAPHSSGDNDGIVGDEGAVDSADAETAMIAGLLRRATFGPAPGRVGELAELGYEGVLDALLAGNTDVFDEPMLDVPDGNVDDDELLITWWIDQMRRPRAGLHEKMVWFWHNHFTSSIDKCSSAALRRQHSLVRRHALGNFRQFAKEMVINGAMLMYLDGGGSSGRDPNENLARELMELFTVGRGNYTEDDVKEAAKALSGWWVDWESGEPTYDRDLGYLGVIRFMGHQGRFSPADVIDILCDHPNCAPFVARKAFVFLLGVEPTADQLAEVANVFASADLDIAALVAAILDRDDLDLTGHGRPRQSVEWFVATANVLSLGPTIQDHVWMLESLDQVPFAPPNVAGWPQGERWISPSLSLAKANATIDLLQHDQEFGFNEANPIPEVLAHCGLYDVSTTTQAALEEAYWAPFDANGVHRLLLFLALTSPEFTLT